MSHIDDITERRLAVHVSPVQPAPPARPAWHDYARDRGTAAIVYLTKHYDERYADQDIKPGYYVVEVTERDDVGRVLRWGRSGAYNTTVEAAQFCLDRWAARFVAGEQVPQDEVLQCYHLMLQKGLVCHV